jgi:hypothetical protein
MVGFVWQNCVKLLPVSTHHCEAQSKIYVELTQQSITAAPKQSPCTALECSGFVTVEKLSSAS